MEQIYEELQSESRRSILRYVQGIKSPHPKDIETGKTPHAAVYKENKLKLLHYTPSTLETPACYTTCTIS